MTTQSRARSALFHLDPGCSRAEWVKIGMAARAAGLSFDDFNTWSASADNYQGENDCRTAWKTFKATGGVTSASLFFMAISNGWEDPYKCDQSAARERTSAPAEPAKNKLSAADATWDLCEPASSAHDYIMRKKGRAEDLRVYPHHAPPLTIRGQNVAGYLVAPCRDLDGQLQTLQFIPGAGDKLNLPRASFGEGCFIVGDIAESSRAFIVEGLGQAWSAWQATGDAAIVCFGAGRMEKVAQAVRQRYPSLRLVVLPDRGKEEQAEAIARAVNGEWCALPIDKPANYDANDFMQEHDGEALAVLLDKSAAPPAPEPRFKLLTSADLQVLPPLKWRIRGVLPAEGVASVYGPSASGKSFLSFDMSAAIAEGNSWFGCRVERAPVVFVALEGEAGFRQRVAAWEAHRERMLPISLNLVLQPFKLTEEQDVLDLASVVPSGAVVFIDTLNRAAPLVDENNSRDMGSVLEAVKRLQILINGLIVLVHHTGKDANRGIRGHSSLHAALDAAVEVTRDGDHREWKVAKSKDGTDGDTHPFKLLVKTLGKDSYGDPITSCVVTTDDAAPLRSHSNDSRKRLGGNQRIVYEALAPLFKVGVTGKPGAPPVRPCIELEAAVAAGAARMTCEPRRRATRSREAITSLISRGALGCHEGWLWVA